MTTYHLFELTQVSWCQPFCKSLRKKLQLNVKSSSVYLSSSPKFHRNSSNIIMFGDFQPWHEVRSFRQRSDSRLQRLPSPSNKVHTTGVGRIGVAFKDISSDFKSIFDDDDDDDDDVMFLSFCVFCKWLSWHLKWCCLASIPHHFQNTNIALESLEGSKVVTNKTFGTGKPCSGILVLAFELRNWQVFGLRFGTVLSKSMSSLFQYNVWSNTQYTIWMIQSQSTYIFSWWITSVSTDRTITKNRITKCQTFWWKGISWAHLLIYHYLPLSRSLDISPSNVSFSLNSADLSREWSGVCFNHYLIEKATF